MVTPTRGQVQQGEIDGAQTAVDRGVEAPAVVPDGAGKRGRAPEGGVGVERDGGAGGGRAAAGRRSCSSAMSAWWNAGVPRGAACRRGSTCTLATPCATPDSARVPPWRTVSPGRTNSTQCAAVRTQRSESRAPEQMKRSPRNSAAA